jgi:phosphatidate phosphatase APP1
MERRKHAAVQRFEETQPEKEWRKQAGFQEIESKMPSVKARRGSSFLDNFTSYLGEKNPFSHPINSKDHSLWLLDNTAWQDGEGQPWKAEVVAAYFTKGSGKDEAKAVANLADVLGIADDEEAKKTIAKRLQPLMDSVVPAHTCQIALGGDQIIRLGPSNRDGISVDTVTFNDAYKDGQTITSNAVGIESATPLTTTFADTSGWAVISDIDDTIKKTMTSSPLGILQTTFVDEPEPIAGMPELYKHIKTALDTPPFWYLSASPYNLYPFLRNFRESYYPPGTMILREASWMNLAGFLTSLTQGTEAYKVSRIDKVHTSFPKRKFLLIGDSTQSDPEAYGDAYRKYSTWVGAIFIRKVTNVEPVNESQKNAPERFEKAFKDVPSDIWTVFEDPKELFDKVTALGAVSA